MNRESALIQADRQCLSARMRRISADEAKQIRSQVVRLKEMGRSGKEIEEIVGVRQNQISEIWTAYRREGESSLERKNYGRKPGTHMLLEAWEQEEIREAVVEKMPEDFGIPGKLWTLGRTRQYILKQYYKDVSERSVSEYMKRWGLSCQRPAKRARKQDPKRI